MAKNKPVQYTSNLAKVLVAERSAMTEGLWLAGQYALSQAVNNIPLETGTLRRSGAVTVELPDPAQAYEQAKTQDLKNNALKRPVGSVGGLVNMFVSYNTPYAARLHEGVPPWTPRALKRTAGGKWAAKPAVGAPKWLENALNRVRPQIRQFIAIAMQKRGF